jgi:Tfp pilus assembly protein PilX
MQLQTHLARRQQGSALLICLMMSAVIGLSLASYLLLTQQEFRSVRRSQTWNRTIPVTEAGVEEALALINKYYGTTNSITNWTTTATADGWTLLSANVYQLTRYLGQDSYTVTITNISNSPSIYSVGTLAWSSAAVGGAQPMFAAVGLQSPSSPSTGTSRAVLVQTAPPKSYFLFGILAKKGISITGGGTNDSVSSLDPNYAANPWSMALEHANGSIGTIESNIVTAFDESSSTIYGHVFTGPGSTVGVSGGSGGIGDPTWLASNPGKIENGWTNNNLNIAVPDAPSAPTVTAWSLPPAINNTYVLPGVPGTTTYYSIPSGLNVGGGGTILITNGAVGLICAGDFTLSGGSGIAIAPGSSVVAYFNGKTTLSGQGIINQTGYAANCTFYGSSKCTSITYSGSSSFIGTVWAPYAAYTQSGGSGVIGAMIVYSFSQSGGKSLFRYDETLGLGASSGVYRVVSWQEVPVNP